jgi:site-specific recombinase XerD
VKPLGGWPEPFKQLNEPIRSLVGRYEAGLVRERTHSEATLRSIEENIEAFFYDHPKVRRPEQVLITDVEDWRLARLDSGDAPNSVRHALCSLKTFYNWLIRETDFRGDNPVWIPPVQSRMQVPDVRNQVTSLHPDLRPASEEQ